MPFKKGQSGNPGGRPKDVFNLAETCRGLTPKAIRVLEEVLNNSAEPKLQLEACKIILERGFGKSLQQVNITGQTPLQVQVADPDKVREYIAELAASHGGNGEPHR